MKIRLEKTPYHKYAFYFTYTREGVDFCRYLKTTYGWEEFTFNGDKKAWVFSDPKIIGVIKEQYPLTLIEEEVYDSMNKNLARLMREKYQEEKAVEIKTQTDSDIAIHNLKTTPLPHQKIAVEFFNNNEGKAILADSMGTGKTLSVLSYVVHNKFKRVLVISPSNVKYSWESEVKKHTHLKSFVIMAKTKKKEILKSKANVLIINYDILKKFLPELLAIDFDLVVADECHLIKGIATIRTKATKAIMRKAPRSLLLSGTPMLSRPVELYNALNIIDPDNWNNWYSFTRKYCAGRQTYFGYDVRGSSNVEELKEKINRYFLRRTKEDILKDLPPKVFIDHPVEMDAEHVKEYSMIKNNFGAYLKSKGKTPDEIMSSLQAEKLTKLGYLRQVASSAKIEAAKELVETLVSNGEKVLVFSCYNGPLEELHKHFKGSVIMIGDSTAEERRDMITKFQEDPECKIFLGGIRSAGVGITLTAASSVVFIDYSWNPADHAQAVDRAHRIGSKHESISIYQMYSKGTIDEYVKMILNNKQNLFDKLIGGSINESLVDEVWNNLKTNEK